MSIDKVSKRLGDKEYRNRPENKLRQKEYYKIWAEKKAKDPKYVEKERIRKHEQGKINKVHKKEVYDRRMTMNKLLNRKDIQSKTEINLRYYKKKFKLFGDLFNLSSRGYGHALGNWARLIKENGDFKCKVCGVDGTYSTLRSHHLLYKNNYPLLSLNINNGITLCIPCHKEVHNPKGGDWS